MPTYLSRRRVWLIGGRRGIETREQHRARVRRLTAHNRRVSVRVAIPPFGCRRTAAQQGAQQWPAAWASTKSVLAGFGLAMVAEFTAGVLMVATWGAWVAAGN